MTLQRRSYQTAETIVYDPVTTNRNATVASLHSMGFRNVELAASLETLNNILGKRSPDLLLCEAAGAELDVCQFVQAIRQGTLTPNPFKVIIATTWRRDGAVVGQLLNSGADDLLARPFSTAALADRIKLQIDRRKGFVVTADYIGPDRRREPGRSGAECFDAPNSLRIRTQPDISAEDADRQIAAAVKSGREMLNIEKMRRNAFQLCVQWRLLEQRRPGGRDFTEILSRIQTLNSEIARRAGEGGDGAVCGICESINASLGAIKTMTTLAKQRDDQSAVDLGPPLHLLGQAALSLSRNFSPNDGLDNLVELDALVARIDVHRHVSA